MARKRSTKTRNTKPVASTKSHLSELVRSETSLSEKYGMPPTIDPPSDSKNQEDKVQKAKDLLHRATAHYEQASSMKDNALKESERLKKMRTELEQTIKREKEAHQQELKSKTKAHQEELSQKKSKFLEEISETRTKERDLINQKKAEYLAEQTEYFNTEKAQIKKAKLELKSRSKQIKIKEDQQLQKEQTLIDWEEKLNAHEFNISEREAKVSLQLIELKKREKDARNEFELDKARILNEAHEELSRSIEQRRQIDEDIRQQRQKVAIEIENKRAAVNQELIDHRHEVMAKLENEVAEHQKTHAALRDQELSALRNEKAQLEKSIIEIKAQEKLDVNARELSRSDKWVKDEEDHVTKEAERKRKLDEELNSHREATLEGLRQELTQKREEYNNQIRQIEEDSKKTRDEKEEQLKLREVALDQRQTDLMSQLKQMRKDRLALDTDKTIFDEKVEDFESRVERIVSERSERTKTKLSAIERQLDDVRQERDYLEKQLQAVDEIKRRLGNREPDELLNEYRSLKKECASLKLELQDRLDSKATERLEQLERDREEWLGERATLMTEKAKIQQELDSRRISAVKLETVVSEKEALEVHKKILKATVKELNDRVDQLTEQDSNKDPLQDLSELDHNPELQDDTIRLIDPVRTGQEFSRFVQDLRHRVARGLDDRELYYSERDLRCFIGGLSMSRLILLQGISGTGKTSLPKAFASAIGAGEQTVEVQAGWRDLQDLVGYYNAFHRLYYTTSFLRALYTAGTPAYKDRPFFIILDEMNLSRPEQFFASFLSALEQPPADRLLNLMSKSVMNGPRLISNGRDLPIPPNVWFIGTANHDESTMEFADKTYDRAHVMEMPRNTEAARFNVNPSRERAPIRYSSLNKQFDQFAKLHIDQVKASVKWLNKAKFTKTLQEQFRVGWGNRLEKQMASYIPTVIASGGTIGEAVDHIIATKLLRKLRDRHDVHVRGLEEISTQLENEWFNLDDQTLPERSIELLRREIQNKQGEEFV
jgi:hypothetical protein